MRQAIIVENPKWEPFTKVSDAFKSVKGAAVLVVRGNNKEIKIEAAKKPLVKKAADSPECLAADLRKLGKSQDEINKAMADFNKSKKSEK